MKALAIIIIIFFFYMNATAFRWPVTDRLDKASVKVLTLVSDTVTLDNQKKIAIIFAGGYACSSCYGELENAIRSIDSTMQIVILLRVTGSSVVSRKEEIKRMEKLVRSRSFYFDITSQIVAKIGRYDDGLFGFYDITVSPSVLFLLPDRAPIFLGYTTLFDKKYGQSTTTHCMDVIRDSLEK
jgi:hypothetical protein